MGRRPRPREVAIEIDRVVAEKVRARDPLAVEVLDRALGVDFVERPLVLERALDEEAGEAWRIDELAGWIFDAHRQREPVAVDIAGDPPWRAAIRPE